MYQRGDSGQKYTLKSKGTAGIKAEPNYNRHAMVPVFLTMRLAAKPRKMPNAVQSCQHMTRPPRMDAGTVSAQNIGTVDALRPIPIPRSKRLTSSWGQVWLNPHPIGVSRQNIAEIKIAPRRPNILLAGSEIQQPSKVLAM